MLFKRNKNQENECDVCQWKHKVTTKYYVKLDDGQFVSKNWYDDAVSQGTGEYWMYSMDKLEDAKKMQREYGGTIFEEVSETYVRPYVSNKVPSQHQCVVMGKDDTWVTMNDKIKQLRNDGAPKSHVEADMTTDVRLDDELAKSINALTEALSTVSQHEDNADKEHQPKIHELPNQPLFIYTSDGSIKYVWRSSDREIVELLSKPNARLAIIEEDHA